jgi:hypothetical protein
MQAFSCFASELAAAFRDGHAVLFCILAASLTLLASVLSLKAWRRRFPVESPHPHRSVFSSGSGGSA